ncbi:MAG: sugar ABC transporter substrate-binding protein [Chloroflexi bacterium]|nr:sugar ABC transporter substrate-binding protein [Chloroflexota bacterium]
MGRTPQVQHVTRRRFGGAAASLAALAGATALAACGRAGGPTGETTAPSPGKIGPATLDVQLNFGSLEQPYLEKHIGAFMQKYPQVKVAWTSTQGDEHYKKLTTMVAGGTPPHLSHMTSRWAGQFIRGMGIYTDLTPLAKADKFDLKDFWPLLSEGFSDASGKPMVLPYDITVQLLYFNADLLNASGAPLPTDRWTLDDLLAAAQKATRKGADGKYEQFGYDGLPNGGQFEYGVERFGGRLLDEKLAKCEMNSAGSVRGVEFWTDLRHRHHVAPATAEDRAGQNMRQMFSTGRLGMVIGGTTFAAQVRDDKASFSWDVLPVPRGPAGDQLRSGGGGYGLHQGVKNLDAAWLFLQHLVSAEVLMDMVGQPRRSVPGRITVAKVIAADTSTSPKNWKVIIPVTEKARHITFGLTPKGGDILEEVTPALNKIYNGGTNVKSELDGLTQRINAILGTR